MLFRHWLVLFAASCYGNMLGLNISAGMRSAISIYILIPLLLVPQLLFGGAMIRFDDLHKSISNKIYVPVIGDVMATRWAYEAMMVEQFKSNKYQKPLFDTEMEISHNDWHASFLLPRLRTKIEECRVGGNREEYRDHVETNFRQLNTHFKEFAQETGILPGGWISNLNRESFNDKVAIEATRYADSVRFWYRARWLHYTDVRDSVVNARTLLLGKERLAELRERHHNQSISDMVLNRNFVEKLYETDERIIQKADPVYMAPGSDIGRAHFFAPFKKMGSLRIGTLLFNALAMSLICLFLFVTLYFNVLRRLIDLLESFHLPLFRKFTSHLLP
jgi:hypothetical protein